jgi:uncharacterized membrane protein YeaQ/YmgE (transglycosylase-associated protein family)
MLNKSAQALCAIGIIGGGIAGWATRPLVPTFSHITSANPEQAFLMSIAGNVLLYAVVAGIAGAVIGQIFSKSSH